MRTNRWRRYRAAFATLKRWMYVYSANACTRVLGRLPHHTKLNRTKPTNQRTNEQETQLNRMILKQLVLNHLACQRTIDAAYAREFWLSRWCAADPQNSAFYESQWPPGGTGAMTLLPKHVSLPSLSNEHAQSCVRWLELSDDNQQQQQQQPSPAHTSSATGALGAGAPAAAAPPALANKFLHLLVRILLTLKDPQIVFRAAAVKALAAVIESDASVLSIVRGSAWLVLAPSLERLDHLTRVRLWPCRTW